jgi:hypothetical protein
VSPEGPEAAQAESETTKKAADKRMRSFFMMRLLCWLTALESKEDSTGLSVKWSIIIITGSEAGTVICITVSKKFYVDWMSKWVGNINQNIFRWVL